MSDYVFIYSMVSQNASQGILSELRTTSGQSYATIQLASTVNQANNNTNPFNGPNPLGPSPSTAVAMIILYSITGIITALFLIIIITGAVRAHRHPERYGPRNVLGRTRQSRAKGLARAMLDTLPIVKFGEREENKHSDVELAGSEAATSSHVHGTSTEGTGRRLSASAVSEPETADVPHPTSSLAPVDRAAIPAATGTAAQDISDATEGLGCSICTDDFEIGQDIRVLPCQHKFHPACIDPWLLNISGTCPLCRIDLRPSVSNTSEGAEGDTALAPPLSDEAVPGVAVRRRSAFMNILGGSLRGMQDATPAQRLEMLRRVQEEQLRLRGAAPSAVVAEEE
ncbi:hypothetical protein LTR16_005820, partial [Cryomyces antarcticus]